MTESLGENKIDEQTNLAHWERSFQRPFYNIPSVFRKECPKMSDFGEIFLLTFVFGFLL